MKYKLFRIYLADALVGYYDMEDAAKYVENYINIIEPTSTGSPQLRIELIGCRERTKYDI